MAPTISDPRVGIEDRGETPAMPGKGKVLVVDDSPESLKILVEMLTTAGYDVRPADSGELALHSVLTRAPELILLDLRMPRIDGYEVCRRLKAAEHTRHIPIMFISSAGELPDRVRGFAAGAVDFVCKPFQREELLARVSTHLELGRLQTQLERSVAIRTRQMELANQQLRCELAERKQAEAALIESEQRFRSMADTAPVMICVSGPDKLATFFNTAWLTFTGGTLEENLGTGWLDRLHPEDRERSFRSYAESFDGRKNCEVEYRLRRADGEYRSVLCRGVPRFAPTGIFAGYIASVVDITEIRCSQAEDFARQKLESLGVLAGGIAHDFNNLLGSILADAEVALADLASGSYPCDEIERIRKLSIRGGEIVRGMMTYAGHDDHEVLEAVDLARLLDELRELLHVSISKQTVLNICFQQNCPAVLGRAAQLRQVLMNLITNASEAIGTDSGVITVTISHLSQSNGASQRQSHPAPNQGHVLLEVSDNGCGMPPEVTAKIFDPFFTTKFAGRGLGLAVVQSIVRAHGGTIDLVSSQGKGTTIRITLPCVTSTATKESKSVPAPATSEQSLVDGATVLLVEDEDTLRLAVSKMLRRRGFSVIEAHDGCAAIDTCRTQNSKIDLILLDLTIPGVSSREVLDEAMRVCPGVKVILTTAYNRDTAMRVFSAPQISGFIRKPFQLAELLKLVRDSLYSNPSV